MTTARKASVAHEDGWMTLQAAADALGATRTKTLALIVKGDLIGEHIAKRTVVRRDSVEAYLARRDAGDAG